MSIQKVNNALEFLKASSQCTTKRGMNIDLDSTEKSSVICEAKDDVYTEEEKAQLDFLASINRKFTRKMKYDICKDIIKHMYDFRIAHFSSEQATNNLSFDENGRVISSSKFYPSSFEFANDTVRILSEWIEKEFENNGNFFDIVPFIEYANYDGYYERIPDSSSPIYVNCKRQGPVVNSNPQGFLETVIYHELTHHLQNIVYYNGKWSIEHMERDKEWKDRWTEKEATYCANYALSHRLYKCYRTRRFVHMSLDIVKFNFHEYYEKMFDTNFYVVDHDGYIYFNADDLMKAKHI